MSTSSPVDLYDAAKPVRDAAWGEVQRCLGNDEVPPAIIEGHRLGTHFQALCVIYCANRYKDFRPRAVEGDDLLDVYAIAAAQLLAHMAGTCRPMVGGATLKPDAERSALPGEVRRPVLPAARAPGARTSGFQHSISAERRRRRRGAAVRSLRHAQGRGEVKDHRDQGASEQGAAVVGHPGSNVVMLTREEMIEQFPHSEAAPPKRKPKAPRQGVTYRAQRRNEAKRKKQPMYRIGPEAEEGFAPSAELNRSQNFTRAASYDYAREISPVPERPVR